jgi:hypothetical protein
MWMPDRQSRQTEQSQTQSMRSALVSFGRFDRSLEHPDLMAKRKNLQLERCAAAKRPDKTSDDRREYRPERQAIDERQRSIYHSHRDFRERQALGSALCA